MAGHGGGPINATTTVWHEPTRGGRADPNKAACARGPVGPGSGAERGRHSPRRQGAVRGARPSPQPPYAPGGSGSLPGLPRTGCEGPRGSRARAGRNQEAARAAAGRARASVRERRARPRGTRREETRRPEPSPRAGTLRRRLRAAARPREGASGRAAAAGARGAERGRSCGASPGLGAGERGRGARPGGAPRPGRPEARQGRAAAIAPRARRGRGGCALGAGGEGAGGARGASCRGGGGRRVESVETVLARVSGWACEGPGADPCQRRGLLSATSHLRVAVPSSPWRVLAFPPF